MTDDSKHEDVLVSLVAPVTLEHIKEGLGELRDRLIKPGPYLPNILSEALLMIQHLVAHIEAGPQQLAVVKPGDKVMVRIRAHDLPHAETYHGILREWAPEVDWLLADCEQIEVIGARDGE
jgi:hypothetical protein